MGYPVRAAASVQLTAVDFTVGENVEVWSNSRENWLPAVVQGVYLAATTTEGFDVPPGSVKVISSAGVKWVMADSISSVLRKASAEGLATMSKLGAAGGAPSSSTRKLCKNGCGRLVQPGLTRGLKPYDTCCKRCAQKPGANEHDENCGGANVTRAVQCFDVLRSLRDELEAILHDKMVLEQTVRTAFQRVSVPFERLSWQQLRAPLEELLEPFGVRLGVKDHFLEHLCQQHGQPEDRTIDTDGILALSRTVLEDRYRSWFPEILPVSTASFVKQNKRPLEEVYAIGKKLGEGSFGTVYEVDHKLSGERRVCKKIWKTKSDMTSQQILQEIGNMAMLDHPNVIKVFEYFDEPNFVSQIMEPCYGGELQDKVAAFRKTGKAPYDEAFVCDVMKQTLRALAFMHKKPFLHKDDLKPQNIMLVDQDSSSIKVIDFGLAELFNPMQKFANFIGGTRLYMAPEVFRQQMTVKTDIWSAGVILYNLLTGDFPFLAQWPPPKGKDEAWPRTQRKLQHDTNSLSLLHKSFRQRSDRRAAKLAAMFVAAAPARTVSRSSEKDQAYTRVSGDEEAVDADECTDADCGMSETKHEKWTFVGNGRGHYKRSDQMLFVGDGQGNYEKEEVRTRGGSCWRILALVALIAIVLGYLIGALLIRRSPFRDATVTYSCRGTASQWLIEERDWCCSERGIGCWATTSPPEFDCKADQDQWDISWSVPKKHFCCSFVDIGCDEFDCQLQLHQWRTSWSVAKKRFCCDKELLGCDTCDRSCETNGQTASCEERAADLYSEVRNCSRAREEVLQRCPACKGCRIEDLSCHYRKPQAAKAAKVEPKERSQRLGEEVGKVTTTTSTEASAVTAMAATADVCEKPPKVGFMWIRQDGLWRQRKVPLSGKAPDIAAGAGFMWHRSADGWKQVCIPHARQVSPPTTPAGDGFMWLQTPEPRGGKIWAQVPLRVKLLQGISVPQHAAGVGYMFHRSTDGWQQVLAPESLSHRQRPCERRAGLGLRWVYAASDHGNAWQQQPVPNWQPDTFNPQPSVPAGPGFMWSFEPGDHGWTQICIPGWQHRMNEPPGLRAGLGFMWREGPIGSWQQVPVPRGFRASCEDKPPNAGFVSAGKGFMWTCAKEHEISAWTQVHRDSTGDRPDAPPREPPGNGLMWIFQNGAWQQRFIPGWTARDAPHLPAGAGLMWNRVTLNGRGVWRQDIIPDWDVDSAAHPPSEPAGHGFMWQYVDKGGQKEWTQEEIRDWYADSANHPPREYAGNGEMWRFVSHQDAPGLWTQVAIPDWRTLDQFNPPTPVAGNGFMWHFDEQTGRWKQLRIAGWMNATRAHPPEVPAGVGYMWKWYKENGERHWHQAKLSLSDLTNPHRLPSQPAGQGFKWEYQESGQPHWEQKLVAKPSCTGNDLLMRMLDKDDASRPDAAQCLEHPWFSAYSEVPPTLSVGVLQCVESYARMPELRKGIFLLLAHQYEVQKTALVELRSLFTHFDVRNQGSLSAQDLKAVLVKSGMGGVAAERVCHALDHRRDGQITWTEFTAAAMWYVVCRNNRAIDAAFATFDVDQDGRITARDLQSVLADEKGREAWHKHMPALFEDIEKQEITSIQRTARNAIRSFMHVLKKEAMRYANLDQFRQYLQQNMDFRAGDALYAVS
ncbi:CPK7 [Symbiodinium microadriaticum]|nr:CPK7 [Symbiodinium microadriaticum]